MIDILPYVAALGVGILLWCLVTRLRRKTVEIDNGVYTLSPESSRQMVRFAIMIPYLRGENITIEIVDAHLSRILNYNSRLSFTYEEFVNAYNEECIKMQLTQV